MNNSIRRKISSSLVIVSIGIIAGIIYPLMSREFDDPDKIFNGVIIGFLGSAFLAINEVWLRRMGIRRLKFTDLIIFKSIQYSGFLIALIILVISLDRAGSLGQSLNDYWRGPDFERLIWQEDFFIIVTYALVATIIFILVYLVSMRMGQGVLWNFIIGRYHKPRSQERIFMYLDLNDSTTIAEKLGDVKYHKLLNQFFHDITDSIVLNYGKIYRYIGDEVVVSWSMKKGLRNMNYLNAYFSAKDQISKMQPEYMKKYGVSPGFSAAIHCGEVITGELGEVKSEISYLGEVLLQTSAIEKSCSKHLAQLLVSSRLFNKTSVPEHIKVKKECKVEVLGSEEIDVVVID